MAKKKRVDPEYGEALETGEEEQDEAAPQPEPQPQEECTHTPTEKKNGFCKHR